ncbi:GntR family transcriptional regulator YhfZ [Paraliobacillus sp. JSM ZJ581]|uniref:GntR family transcriptional regulator YhfZ n=1 Tax=Paraliobacillus sp. JSM ZJ581 TaxID=3342118 RepID=UPI0035A8D21D
MWEKFYSKNGLAAKKIAKLFLQLDEKEKIPRVSDYCEILSIGRGTVQNALRLLEEMKAIKLEARGHLGTFLVWKDKGMLLEISGFAPLIGSLPLPYSRKYEGLATGMVDAFETSGSRVNLIYMRGGVNRIEALRTKRCDYAVVSKMTADAMLDKYSNLIIMERLGSKSYVSAHKIFLADEEKTQVIDGMRVGVDRESLDQMHLTSLEFATKNVTYIDVNYMQLFEKLQANEIDATIWNVDEKKISQTFKSISFESEEALRVSKDTSEAVIVIDSEREEEIKDKWASVTKEQILIVQKSVENGEIIPHY